MTPPSRLVRVVLAFTLLYSLSFVRWPADNSRRSHLLAKDTLRAARSSVHDAVQALSKIYEDPLRTGSEAAKLERLQASLDNLPQNMALERVHSPSVDHPVDICESLAGKRITMIGGEHIYRLHVLLLQHRERTEGKPFPCQYHEFCTHHRICLPYQYTRDDTPQPRYVKPPTAQELVDTESAAVNYIVSDTLYSARNETSWEYTSPFVDPTTGVRLHETYWLPAARKANVVVLGRGPLSAPGQTYTGNWSFLHRLPDYLSESRAAADARYENYDDVYALHQVVPRSLDVLNAAVHLTVSRFLPDLFRLLQSIRKEVHPTKQKRLIWPSSWYRLPGRGVARSVLLRARDCSKPQGTRRTAQYHGLRFSTEDTPVLHLSALLDADFMNMASHEDQWTLLFNAQVYLQNVVLRELLPRHGIVFLPLDVPCIEVGEAHGRDFGGVDAGLAHVGSAFLTGVDHVLRYPG